MKTNHKFNLANHADPRDYGCCWTDKEYFINCFLFSSYTWFDAIFVGCRRCWRSIYKQQQKKFTEYDDAQCGEEHPIHVLILAIYVCPSSRLYTLHVYKITECTYVKKPRVSARVITAHTMIQVIFIINSNIGIIFFSFSHFRAAFWFFPLHFHNYCSNVVSNHTNHLNSLSEIPFWRDILWINSIFFWNNENQTVLVAMTQSKEKYTSFLNTRTTTNEPRCFVNTVRYTTHEIILQKRVVVLSFALSPKAPHFCTCLRLNAFETGDAPESSIFVYTYKVCRTTTKRVWGNRGSYDDALSSASRV